MGAAWEVALLKCKRDTVSNVSAQGFLPFLFLISSRSVTVATSLLGTTRTLIVKVCGLRLSGKAELLHLLGIANEPMQNTEYNQMDPTLDVDGEQSCTRTLVLFAQTGY